MAEFNTIIHQPVRLHIMAALVTLESIDEVDFTYLRDLLAVTDGNLGAHLRKLEEADRLNTIQIDLFWDQQRGGFFFTSRDHETLIARSKAPVDSALPSGNAVSAGNLVYLATALNKAEHLKRAEETLRAFAPLLEDSPGGMPRMAVSLAALLDARD